MELGTRRKSPLGPGLACGERLAKLPRREFRDSLPADRQGPAPHLDGRGRQRHGAHRALCVRKGSSGENIYPREIEEVLYSHPRVHEAVVLGVAHEVAGQVVKAFIVPRPGETLTRREVLIYCGERLAKYKVPRQIEFRDSLPKTLTGKVLRRALQEEERGRARQGRGTPRSTERQGETEGGGADGR